MHVAAPRDQELDMQMDWHLSMAVSTHAAAGGASEGADAQIGAWGQVDE